MCSFGKIAMWWLSINQNHQSYWIKIKINWKTMWMIHDDQPYYRAKWRAIPAFQYSSMQLDKTCTFWLDEWFFFWQATNKNDKISKIQIGSEFDVVFVEHDVLIVTNHCKHSLHQSFNLDFMFKFVKFDFFFSWQATIHFCFFFFTCSPNDIEARPSSSILAALIRYIHTC